MADLIDRQAAIDAIQQHRESVLGGYEYDEGVAFVYAAAHNHIIDVIKRLPSAQPERKTECLTEDEIKAIRIHMNAFKERLCNQHRWKEAEEYQQIVDKLDVMLPRSEPYQEGEQNG